MKTTILETIKRNENRIRGIKKNRNKFIENIRIKKDVSSRYTIKVGDNIIVEGCSLDFILGDPLGFLNHNSDNWVVKARIYKDGYCNDSLITIKFRRYENDNSVIFIFDMLIKEQKLLLNTSKFSSYEPRIILGENKDTFSLHLVGNDYNAFCSRCGRLKNKHMFLTRDTVLGQWVCKDVCEKYTSQV